MKDFYKNDTKVNLIDYCYENLYSFGKTEVPTILIKKGEKSGIMIKCLNAHKLEYYCQNDKCSYSIQVDLKRKNAFIEFNSKLKNYSKTRALNDKEYQHTKEILNAYFIRASDA